MLHDMTPAYQTESCFTPDGTQWAIDATSLKLMRECWYKYHLAIRLGLRATGEAAPLKFGQLLHLGREVYYKSRFAKLDHQSSLRRAVRAVLTQSSIYDEDLGRWQIWWSYDRKRNTMTLLRTLICRLDEVQDDAEFTVSIEGKPAVELPFRFELNRLAADDRPYALVGWIDRLLDTGSRVWPEDYKHTTSTFGAAGGQSVVKERFAMDPQMTIYTIAGQVIFNQPVSGVLVDLHNVQIGDTTCVRAPIERPDEYIEEWLDELNDTINELEINVANNRWPHRDTSCFLCSFKSICPRAPSQRWRHLETGFYQHKWNPLAIREA